MGGASSRPDQPVECDLVSAAAATSGRRSLCRHSGRAAGQERSHEAIRGCAGPGHGQPPRRRPAGGRVPGARGGHSRAVRAGRGAGPARGGRCPRRLGAVRGGQADPRALRRGLGPARRHRRRRPVASASGQGEPARVRVAGWAWRRRPSALGQGSELPGCPPGPARGGPPPAALAGLPVWCHGSWCGPGGRGPACPARRRGAGRGQEARGRRGRVGGEAAGGSRPESVAATMNRPRRP